MAVGDSYKGTVNNIHTSDYSVSIGYDINAHNATGLPIALGDTVEVTERGVGIWEITRRITEHPPPVIPDPPPPPAKPSISVSQPGAASGSVGSVFANSYSWTGFPLNLGDYDGVNLTFANRLNTLWGNTSSLAGTVATAIAVIMDMRTVTLDLVSKVNDLRSSVQQLTTQLGSTVSYAESTGGAALSAVGDVADAGVSAGTAARVPDLSIGPLPGAADNVAGHATLSGPASNSISLWLEHRGHWMQEIRTHLNAALTHRGLAPVGAITSPLWDLASLADNWSACVARIQANDDAFAGNATILRNGIGTLRANLGMTAFSYPSGVLAWSAGGTFAAGKAALAASLSAHHTYYTTGLGTALAQAIRTKINI